MFIQINTDNQIHSGADVNERLEGRVRDKLKRFEERLTRVEVHISDVDGPRGGGDDKRASVEARPTGLAPVAAVADANSVDAAVSSAATKVARVLDHTFGKLTDRKGH
ncbi:MAG TPA: HPF/RaiA family ribosome-associated protein [Allosphingosinicella sp.]|nr:HPF/RaiA family ribosome-associated protein [Allosphingosinicella sp.]